jgi:NADH-quinone oxidoreductase subunit J
LTWEVFVFYLAAALVIGSALVVTFSRKLINAGFALLATFAGVAILYGILGASFIAGSQVLLYIGGVLVLLLFAIVLTRDVEHARISMTGSQRVLAVLLTAATLVLIWTALNGAAWLVGGAVRSGPTPHQIGSLFMRDYILPFEAISVVLLIALVGAGYMARRKS